MTPLLRLLVVFALCVLPVTVYGRDLSADEQTALVKAVTDFDTAMKSNDLETIIKTVPPEVIAYIAVQSGTTDDELRAAMIAQMTEAMAQIKIVSFTMDVENAEHRELSDGTPYVMIPTVTVLDMGATGKIKAESPTLGLMKDGVWYLMRIADENQIKMLTGAFPEFTGEEFPAGTMEPFTE